MHKALPGTSKKSALAAALSAAVFAAVTAGTAFAGEVTGNGEPTAAPANANSICAFSGQNDRTPRRRPDRHQGSDSRRGTGRRARSRDPRNALRERLQGRQQLRPPEVTKKPLALHGARRAPGQGEEARRASAHPFPQDPRPAEDLGATSRPPVGAPARRRPARRTRRHRARRRARRPRRARCRGAGRSRGCP